MIRHRSPGLRRLGLRLRRLRPLGGPIPPDRPGRRPLVAGLAVLLLVGVASPARSDATRVPVSFEVTNLHEPGETRTIHGYRMDPACDAETVVLLQHGLSYTSAAWDWPAYSYAQALVDAGYAVVAIDRLGYGESVVDSGYDVSTFAHHDIGHQIVAQLRERGYDHVAIGGHSAGGEASIGAAGTYGGVDALLVLGYHHVPAPELVAEFVTGDGTRAARSDYEYFLETPEKRKAWFYAGDFDPAVAEADNAAAVLTPSGEIATIGPQPSRLLQTRVDVPVFLQLADQDRLFPAEYAEEAAALYVSAPLVTVDLVPDAGHTFLLHDKGPAAAARAAAWLGSQAATPPCTP